MLTAPLAVSPVCLPESGLGLAAASVCVGVCQGGEKCALSLVSLHIKNTTWVQQRSRLSAQSGFVISLSSESI